jgi:exodeoxyribonuclease VII large subunit
LARLWTAFALEGRMNIGDTTLNPVPTQPVISVSDLNQAVAKMLERNFPLAWVSGEISNFTRAASGHWYFTLKDSAAQVRAVMFRGRAQYASFTPRAGDKVEVRALVTLYAARGDFQLSVEAIRRAGVGNLYEAFLRLKEKLQAAGLFDADRKRTLPQFVKTIGIVTSPQAAALRDILTTLRRRAPHVNVILYPTPVQGENAGQKIAQAIATASARAECDVLLVCRGGGSIEDLWSFNEEIVARTIAHSDIPVVSGIGHESDFTIADFVADLRAPTPTAAAELAVSARADWIAALEMHAEDLARAFRRGLSDRAQALDWLSRRMVSPTTAIVHERLKLNGLNTRLQHAIHLPLTHARFALAHLRTRWMAQLPDTRAKRLQIAEYARRMETNAIGNNQQSRRALMALDAQLELLNPQRTLERGYAMVTDAHGKIVRSPHELHPRTTVTVRLAEGSAELGIASVQALLD